MITKYKFTSKEELKDWIIKLKVIDLLTQDK